MKTTVPCPEFGVRRAVSGPAACLVAAALLLAPAAVGAQVYDRPLTEQDLQRLVPVLRAEKAGSARIAQQAMERQALEQKRAAARQQAVAAITAGTDPLEWLTKASPNAVTPSTARYQAPCSHALTQSTGEPSAVFSFGMHAPPAWLAVWKARDNTVPIRESQTASQPGAQRAGAPRPEAVVQQARAFYSGRSFESQGEPAPFEWLFVAPDRLVSATIMGVNVLGRVEACRNLANGPTIVLNAEGDAFAKGPAKAAPTTNRELALALEKEGLRREEYLNLREQLRVAQADAKDPSRLTAPASATEEQLKALAIRGKNAAFYREHADLISPLLEGIG